MNKQELIGILEGLEGDSFIEKYNEGYDQAVRACLIAVKQLDEPKKVVVPKFVANFIEDGKHYDKIAFLVHQKYLGINSLMRECPVKDWLMSVDYETVLSLVNGYEVEKEPTIHELKILPEYFEAVVSGNKRFEIRKNDRNYQKGDILRLNEYQDGQYTGDVHVAEITYITDYAQQDGYVVLGIK